MIADAVARARRANRHANTQSTRPQRGCRRKHIGADRASAGGDHRDRSAGDQGHGVDAGSNAVADAVFRTCASSAKSAAAKADRHRKRGRRSGRVDRGAVGGRDGNRARTGFDHARHTTCSVAADLGQGCACDAVLCNRGGNRNCACHLAKGRTQRNGSGLGVDGRGIAGQNADRCAVKIAQRSADRSKAVGGNGIDRLDARARKRKPDHTACKRSSASKDFRIDRLVRSCADRDHRAAARRLGVFQNGRGQAAARHP